ncbi:helix-turn-helix transcriptional regulator [Hansschlegelia zhihuaiae]|uniref:helix-turn-helix transcriptional regulator n=1 Tax=Hansschlegelia zhihuaiae TaxID=405005 RepID=UPI0019D4348B|nr:hypothetical protein [Hansschlegelia zhihuaiae]
MVSAALPPGIIPRGLPRDQAAAYLGLTPRQFMARVREGHLPGPIPGSQIWDRAALDAWLDQVGGLVQRVPNTSAEAEYEAWKARRAG